MHNPGLQLHYQINKFRLEEKVREVKEKVREVKEQPGVADALAKWESLKGRISEEMPATWKEVKESLPKLSSIREGIKGSSLYSRFFK